jgi:hypothetical protein
LATFRLFLGERALKERRASLFWAAVSFATLGFAGYIISFFIANYIFMPVPFEISIAGFNLLLPGWTRGVMIALSILPFIDMFFLTYLAISNLLKWGVRWHIGRKHNFTSIRIYKDVLSVLPRLLMG